LPDGLVAVTRPTLVAGARPPQAAECERGAVDVAPRQFVPVDADGLVEQSAGVFREPHRVLGGDEEPGITTFVVSREPHLGVLLTKSNH
jgi:hypothetical protein